MAWKKGESGNPQGRKGHKDRFVAKFWADMLYAWEKHGPDAIERTIQLSPDKFVNICASLQPKEQQRQEVMHSIEVTLKQPQWLIGDNAQAIDITPKRNNEP